MRKTNMIFIALGFAIILTTLIINPVFALSKHGPTPIPGNLFPHPSALHTHILKHAAEKPHLLQVVSKS